uniref:NADH-ubiquinone oxidoreductase chain 5 n=1 Tax=Cephalothrix sp. SCS-2010 TaxID=743460 RepID=E7C1B6_9BILA|nr:NADH dehydrogenase subunit 5 [Cephalothrix sp. SCS-2010]ADD62176.1 NADH dehydrogenase subunit 5 [Cephalothrix sp. SCS-2010]
MFYWFHCFSMVSSFFLYFFSFLLMYFLVNFMYYGKVYIFDWSLFEHFPFDVNMSFVFDWLGMSFSCLVLFISASVMFFSSSYMSNDENLRRFVWLVLLFVMSMNLLVFIPNLIAILLGWDGLGLVSFLLVIYYQNYKSFSAGMLTVLMNRVGDVMLLLSIGWFLVQGHWNIFFCFDFSYSFFLMILLMVAAMTKSAQIPFSSWLPAAMAAPTPVSALVHSSTLVTAGVFLLIRFFNFLSLYPTFFFLLLFISVITMFMAGLSANMETDLKKIIALSTLSQLGVMMFSLGMGLPMLALFHLYTHALFKALLFLRAGLIIHNVQHYQDLRCVGKLGLQMPVSISCLNVANLALCGSPFLAGFYSKDMILEMFVFYPWNILIFLMVFLATGFTAMYSFRLSYMSLWNTFNFFPFHNMSDEDYKMIFPMIVLVLGAVMAGSMFSWVFFDFFSFLILPLFLKIMALFFTLAGGSFGWFISKSLNNYGKSFFNLIGYSSVSMWYLVILSTQILIYYPLRLSKNFLYVLDRGWNELFGGKGILIISEKSSSYVLSWQTSIYMSYLFVMIISYFMFMFLFLIFF